MVEGHAAQGGGTRGEQTSTAVIAVRADVLRVCVHFRAKVAILCLTFLFCCLDQREVYS